MANAATLAGTSAAKILMVGYPGAGKTGSLVSLANAGLKLRILAYDKVGNMQPLFQYIDPDKLANVDIVLLEDKLRSGAKFMETVGIPTAFADGLKMMDQWKYETADGTTVDLGCSKDWGPDTVVVVDSLTSMGEAAKRRAMVMLNKTPLNSTQQMWGLAMQDQWAFCEKLLSSQNRFHVIVMAHLKMISPKDFAAGDSDLTKELKEKIADIVPTRLYPSALGQQNPQWFGGLFGTVLLVEPEYKGTSVRRVIRSLPRPELDLKLPTAKVGDKLDIKDGLLAVVTALTGGPEQWFRTEEKRV